MKDFSISPYAMYMSLWHYRELIKATAKREVLGRYRGSMMGIFWSFLTPLLMLAVYTFVFSVVFKARWGTGSGSKTEFALVLFAGLIVFNLFAECINRAPNLIVVNVNYVKKVIFPLEILPVASLVSALFHGVISLGVWLLAYFFFYGLPHVTIFYLPLIVLPLIFFIMGLSWFLAALGVYLRDVAQFISLATTVLMFMSPIFYPVSALPPAYQHLIYLNPLTMVIEQVREVLYFGSSPDFFVLAMYWVITFVVAWLGFVLFQRARKGFADVL